MERNRIYIQRCGGLAWISKLRSSARQAIAASEATQSARAGEDSANFIKIRGRSSTGTLSSAELVLVVVDYYSWCYEITIMKSMTVEKTVKVLKTIFARRVLTLTIHTDSGPLFVSEVLADYMKSIGMIYLKMTP